MTNSWCFFSKKKKKTLSVQSAQINQFTQLSIHSHSLSLPLQTNGKHLSYHCLFFFFLCLFSFFFYFFFSIIIIVVVLVVVVVVFFSFPFEKFHWSFASTEVLFPAAAIYLLCALKKGKQITRTEQFVQQQNQQQGKSHVKFQPYYSVEAGVWTKASRCSPL